MRSIYYKPLVIYLTTEVTKQWRSPRNSISETCCSGSKGSCFESVRRHRAGVRWFGLPQAWTLGPSVHNILHL